MSNTRFTPVAWYVPCHVPDYDKADSTKEALETITLIAFNDVDEKDRTCAYIPVFNSQLECDIFLRDILRHPWYRSRDGDLAFTICKFENLAELYHQIKEEFNDAPIKIIVKESTSNEI